MVANVFLHLWRIHFLQVGCLSQRFTFPFFWRFVWQEPQLRPARSAMPLTIRSRCPFGLPLWLGKIRDEPDRAFLVPKRSIRKSGIGIAASSRSLGVYSMAVSSSI